MRVLNPFVTVLILGISSFKLANADALDGQNEFPVILKNECEKYGGLVAYDSVIEKLGRLSTYVQRVVRPSEFLSVLENVRSEEINTDMLIDDYCRKVPDLNVYIKGVTDSIKSCVKPDEQKDIDTLYNVISSVNNFVCYNGGERLKQFIDDGGVWTMIYNFKDLDACPKNAFSNYNQTELESGSPKIDKKACIGLKKLKDCVVEAMQQDYEQSPANIMESIFEHILEAAECQEFIIDDDAPETWESKFGDVVTPRAFESYGSFEEKCRKNGGPTAHIIAFESMDLYRTVFQHLKTVPFDSDVVQIHARSDSNWLYTYVKMLCHRAPVLVELVEYLTKSVGPCLEEEEREFLEIVKNVTSVSVEYICHNEGERIPAFLRYSVTKCRQPDINLLLRCAYEAFGLDSSQTFDVSKLLTIYTRPLLLRSQDCINLEKFEQCSVKALAACDHQTSLNLLTPWLDSVKNMLPCKNPERISNSRVFDVVDISNVIPGVTDLGATLENGVTSLREACLKNGGFPAYEEVKTLPRFILKALKSLEPNLVQLNADMKLARPRDELDVVFVRYCHEVSTTKEYIEHIANTIKPCLDPKSHGNVDIVHNMINATLDFMCQDEGSRLARFVATEGLECLANKQHALQSCVTEFSNTYVPSSGPFVPGIRECLGKRIAEACIVKTMEECKNGTPASIIHELIQWISGETPCIDVLGG